MADRAEAGSGFTVLDGVALVAGSAVASVHIRSAALDFGSPVGWAWASCLFGWVALTSAGPYLFLVRRFFTKPPGYPGPGDKLWGMAGLPWQLAAMVRTGEAPGDPAAERFDPAYVGCLAIGLAAWSIVALVTLGARYVATSPARPKPPEPANWTDRVGLFLAVAWPFQCGVGLVVMG